MRGVENEVRRDEALEALSALVTRNDLFVSSIGGLWDDWWNLRPGGEDNTFFPTVLGSVSSTALGLALALPHRRVVAFETDGSVLMNAGMLCTLGNAGPGNLTVVVFDNEMYETIGGLPTLTAGRTDLAAMARAAGCEASASERDLAGFTATAETMLNDGALGFLVAKIAPGVKPWPPGRRKPTDGVEDKYRFIRHVERLEGISILRPTPTQG
jgi:thiamine pyrophosphate-dependent acetolactate synthase large subunit-like protein